MHEALHQYILNRVPITEKEFERVRNSFSPKKLRKKQFFLQEGEIPRSGAFVVKGCLRLYRVDETGHEHIIQFAVENWWITDRGNLRSQKPSPYNIDAIEDSDLLVIAADSMIKLVEEMPAIRKMVQMMNDNNFIANQRRINSAISYTAEEKYREFLQFYPEIVQRVPQQMLASYLGITRETLSRIRKQVATSK